MNTGALLERYMVVVAASMRQVASSDSQAVLRALPLWRWSTCLAHVPRLAAFTPTLFFELLLPTLR